MLYALRWSDGSTALVEAASDDWARQIAHGIGHGPVSCEQLPGPVAFVRGTVYPAKGIEYDSMASDSRRLMLAVARELQLHPAVYDTNPTFLGGAVLQETRRRAALIRAALSLLPRGGNRIEHSFVEEARQCLTKIVAEQTDG